VDDVKARLEAIANSQGKRLAKILRNLAEAMSTKIASWTATAGSGPEHPNAKPAQVSHSNLSPLAWLLVAASCAGAAAGLAVVLGYALLDKSAATAPLNERIATLTRRVDSAEHAQAALANRVTSTEGAIAKTAASATSAIAQIREIINPSAAQSGRHAFVADETSSGHSDLQRLEKRIAALEEKAGASGTALAEMEPASPAGESVQAAASGTRHGESSFPPFDPANFSPVLIWLTLSFGLLYLLMSKIALPRVENILHARKQKMTSDIAEANEYRAKSEEAAAAHEKALAEARAKAVALAQETHARLQAETEAKRAALEAELNAKLSASETQISETKAKAMRNVQAIASDAAAAIVEHITGKPADRDSIAQALAAIKA
jgi:F-type H+-transporting ATPase subunit b